MRNDKIKMCVFSLTIFLLQSNLVPAQVREEWVTRYNGPDNGDDLIWAMAADSKGNVYVTGWSVGAGANSHYATIKYDANGNQVWVARYDGPGNGFNQAYAIAVDAEGYAYVTGTSWGGAETGTDYATIKYNSDGKELWVARYNGPGNNTDRALAIVVSNKGNVYVTGGSCGTVPAFPYCLDYATIKYDPNGNQIWVARYDGPSNLTDEARAIGLDGEENIYVTGESVLVGNSFDYATIKYDSNGNQLWVARYNGPGNGEDRAHAIAVDAFGNSYVTGQSEQAQSNFDYATIKYNTNGNQLWVARYNGPGNGHDVANGIALDNMANVYVTGGSVGIDTAFDYATIKYGPDGNEIWVARYNGPANLVDWANAIALDNNGNIYVTGYSDGIGTFLDYATVKYDPNGDEVWVARYDGPPSQNDLGRCIAVDPAGNVYVAGSSQGAGTGYDYAVIKYLQQ